MALQTRFFKTTKGFNAEVLVAKAVAYTTDADFKTFVANAVDGEIGLFNADTNALLGANVPITVGTRYFYAQKRDSDVKTTTPIIHALGAVVKTAYTAPVKQVATVTFAGTIGTAFNIGDEISVKVIESTPGAEPYPTITYNYTVKAGDTVTSIAAGLVAQFNSTTSLENRDGQGFIVASNAAGVLTLTAKFFQSAFTVSTPGKSYEFATVVQRTTAMKLGSGFTDHVAMSEVEGKIFEGITTQYPMDGFAPGDFGDAATYTDPSLTYDTYNITTVKNEKAVAPIDQHHHYHNTLVFIPTAGGPGVAVSTILGFTAPV